MTYFIKAWVKDGSVVMCQSSTSPIIHDQVKVEGADAVVLAEVVGEYVSAKTVRAALSWDGGALIGLEFANQEVSAP